MKNLKELTDSEFTNIVASSKSFADIRRKLGKRHRGGLYESLHKRIDKQGLSTSHFEKPYRSANFARTRPLSEILIKNSNYNNTGHLKKRLIQEKLLTYKCACCPNEGIWMGKPITLQLDHINGNHKDNRISNLRFLCPNCHDQMETSHGRKTKQSNPKRKCPKCGHSKCPSSKTCLSCANKAKMKDLDIDNIISKIRSSNFLSTARKLGISDNALRKRLRNRGYDPLSLTRSNKD